MAETRKEVIREKMLEIGETIEHNKSKDEQLGTINFYKDLHFDGSDAGLIGLSDVYVAKIENTAENTNTYEIYSGKTNTLIATVNEHGRLNFTPEYIENCKRINPELAEAILSEDMVFELPKELGEHDRVFTKEERERISEERKKEQKERAKAENKEAEGQSEEQEKQEEEQEATEKSPEEEQQEEIAARKGIPSHNVLIVRENSNLYKDHPNLAASEKNLYFYRDNDGVVRAEYLDKDGVPQPSKYFQPASTSLRQETVSLGDDGNPVTKEVPYQVMTTKGLNSADKDIRDVRVNIKIDGNGYLDIEEARQGKNGDWEAHDIEVKGRDYNSYAVNKTTETRTGKADPDKQTEAYKKTEGTGLEKDGIEYGEMYLIQHADEVIDRFIKEGYQKHEAVQIFDYMIGEECLTEEQAKSKVNEEISKRNEHREGQKENEDTPGERIPGGRSRAEEADPSNHV